VARRVGKCVNYDGNCEYALSNKTIEITGVPVGVPAKCPNPKCRQPLHEIESNGYGPRSKKLLGAVAIVLVLALIGGLIWWLGSHGISEEMRAEIIQLQQETAALRDRGTSLAARADALVDQITALREKALQIDGQAKELISGGLKLVKDPAVVDQSDTGSAEITELARKLAEEVEQVRNNGEQLDKQARNSWRLATS
jgi:hypothetical protein